MRTYIKCLAIASLAIGLCACNKEQAYIADDLCVQISADITPCTQTRVTDDGKSFTDGDAITVLNMNRADNNQAVYTYAESSGKWNTTDKLYWKCESDNTFQAWYPSNAAYDAFTIPSDQSEGISASDWMVAQSVAKKSDGKVSFSFIHLLSKVNVTVDKWGNGFSENQKSINKIELKSLSSVLSYDGALSGDDLTKWIESYVSQENRSYTLVLAPGTYASGEEIMKVYVNSSATPLMVKTTSSVTVESGKSYSFKLTVGKDHAEITSCVSVDDWDDEVLDDQNAGVPDPNKLDYIDEYGINHGPGKEINGVIWAPVNCGYHKIDYPEGKFYQWGRKYGQGLIEGHDATVPDVREGWVSLHEGQSEENSNVFFASANSNWCINSYSNLWNLGSDKPIKSEYDPCPDGWRVPTAGEFSKIHNVLSWYMSTSNNYIYASLDYKIHLPLLGIRSNNGVAPDNHANSRKGTYRVSDDYYNMMTFWYQEYAQLSRDFDSKVYGTALRCVKDESGLIPVTCIRINKESVELSLNDYYKLVTTIEPSNANHNYALWWSDNESVATVDAHGNVTAISEGVANITAMAGMKTALCEVIVASSTTNGVVTLDKDGSANSYIVSEAGSYQFIPTKGNSAEPVGTISSAEVLWETFGTDVIPNVGDLVKNVKYENGVISFDTPETFAEGNAVIAAKDASGTILWSWHIWLTDKPNELVYKNNAGTMMDRNLGAISAEEKVEYESIGLLYQWGRKDPFLNAYSITECVGVAKSTKTWPVPVNSEVINGSTEYSVKNPMTFIYSETKDWFVSTDASSSDARWNSDKSIYDPCPAGWRVPDGGENGIWSKAGNFATNGTYWNASYSTMHFECYDSNGLSIYTYYPTIQYINGSNGKLYVPDSRSERQGYYWSCTTKDDSLENFTFKLWYNGYVNLTQANSRASAYAVRCCKEK